MTRWLPAAALGAVALLGCPKLGDLGGLDAYTPKMRFQDVKVTHADFTGADADFVFAVNNPNPIAVKLSSFTYDIQVADHPFLSGDQDRGLELQARGDSELRLPAKVKFADLIELAGAAKGQDTVPFTVSGTFGFATPLGEVRVPVHDSGTLPVLRAPKVRLVTARVASFKPLENKARLELDVGITNKGGANIDLGHFDYKVSLADTQVATGVVEDIAGVAGGEERIVTLPLQIDLLSLGTTVVRAISDKEPVQMGLGASARVGTPLGDIPLTVDEHGRVDLK